VQPSGFDARKQQLTDPARLALSHNLLSTLPTRLVECQRLRYLNVRYNAMREIPEAVRPTRRSG
jgi:Leucine-rich repeat (LRR) protein